MLSYIMSKSNRCGYPEMRKLPLMVVLLCLTTIVQAQFYPVQSTTQLIPPYSVYLSDYATPGNEKLRVILVQRDLTQPSYQLRLVMSVQWNGREIMRTSRAFNPAPINLSPGIPTVISGADLAPYLDSRNLDFVGYSRDQYERTKALPEGSYQITFIAYDYRRQDVQVSNQGTSFYYLAKSEPPLINFPACGTKIPMRTPQQIIFSWLPRNTSSANSAGRTLYEFSLHETRPAGRNPNDIVLSTQPVFRTTTEITQLVYGPAEPLLLDNMTYVWRVRAIDEQGRDAFRNNGYSEVCTFVYGGVDPAFNVGVVENLQAVGETERRAKISWTQGEYDSYKVSYKKTGGSHEWFTDDVTREDLAKSGATTEGELKIFDLEPDTEYETRVQAKKNGVLGPYSDLITFRTQPLTIAQCGDPVVLPEGGTSNPFREAILGTTVMVDGMEMILLDVSGAGQDGWYKGHGKVSIPYLGGAAFTVKFDRIFINADREVVTGRIDFVTKGVAAMIEEQLAGQKGRQKERQQQQNRDIWAGVKFHEKIFLYDQVVIDTMYTDASGNLVVVDESGHATVNTEVPAILKDAPEKAVIIEDKNGDQWVVQEGGQVTKVPGGGLQAGTATPVTDASIDIVKEAIRSLRREYDDAKISALQQSMTSQMETLDRHISAQQQEYATQAVSDEESETIWSNLEVSDEVPAASNSTFDQLSKTFKDSELIYNRAIVIKWLANDLNNKKAYEQVAKGLSINSQNAEDYIQSQLKQGKKNDEIVVAVKGAIIDYITVVLMENLYKEL